MIIYMKHQSFQVNMHNVSRMSYVVQQVEISGGCFEEHPLTLCSASLFRWNLLVNVKFCGPILTSVDQLSAETRMRRVFLHLPPSLLLL